MKHPAHPLPRAALLAILAWMAGCVLVGEARTISFAGRAWHVKTGTWGPGPNAWSDATNSVWVDPAGCLHLRIRREGDVWYCAEVWTVEPTRYGLHRFKIGGRPDALDRNVVFSPFLYRDDENEMDIEFSRWGVAQPAAPNAQYVVQPPPYTNVNHHPFSFALGGDYSTHSLDWRPGEVRFQSIHGHYDEPPEPGYLIQSYACTPPVCPTESMGLNIHLNLWLMNGLPPSDGQEVEMVVHAVDYPSPPP